MRKTTFALISTLVIIASVGTGYLAGTSTQRTTTSVSTVTQTTIVYREPSTYYSQISPEGLQLQIRLNTTNLRQGGGLTAQIVLMNTLNRNITLTPHYSSDSNISTWNTIDFLCGNAPYWGRWGLAGFALFHNHVTPANLSTAGNPLILAPTVAISCAIWPGPSSVVMHPFGDRVVAYFNSSSLLPNPRQAQINASTEYCVGVDGTGAFSCGHLKNSLFGYWDSSTPLLATENATTSSHYFHYFPVGQYTLVAQDLWNQTTYAYFQVVPTSAA